MEQIPQFLGKTAILLLLLCTACSIKQPYSRQDYVGNSQSGVASWYGADFHGKRTANGEIYNMHDFTAAHRFAPFNTIAWVTNKANQKKVKVRINDRGPFVDDRIIDLSKTAAQAIDMLGNGTADVVVEFFAADAKPQAVNSIYYYLQLGSFKELANANALLENLRQSFKKQAFFLHESDFYRIRCGPFRNLVQAEQNLKDLQTSDFFIERKLRGYIRTEAVATKVD